MVEGKAQHLLELQEVLAVEAVATTEEHFNLAVVLRKGIAAA